MKKPIQHHSDRWHRAIFSDTTDPMPQNLGAPAPEEPYSPEPPVNVDFCRPLGATF